MTTTYTSASGAFVPVNVTLFATPQNDATALNVLALFAQDSYSVKRLTVTGGLRFEQLEGYLPAQSSPASPFATAGIGGFAAQPRSYDEVRDIVKWNTAGPRVSAVYRRDRRRQDRRQGVGRPLLLRAVDRRRRRQQRQPRTPTTASSTRGTTRNGDHKFQLGEQTGAPVVTRSSSTARS